MNIIDDIIDTIDSILLKVFQPARWNKLTAKLRDLLNDTWSVQQQMAIEEVIKRIENAGEEFTAEDLELALATLEEYLGRPMSELVGDSVEEIQRSAYEGAFKDLGLKFEFGKKDKGVLQWLNQDALYWIESYYEREVRDKLRETISEVVSSGESRLQAGKRLQAAFGDRVKKDHLYWEGLSNHITTRTREFAKVSGYIQAGVEFIEVRAVLDNRTTQICRYMHGRVFTVESAKEIRSKIMEADTPEAIKKVAPWITGGKVKRMRTMKLIEEGVILPPYHWNCRTTTVMWDESDLEGSKVESLMFGGDVDEDHRKALELYTKEEYSNWVRDFRTSKKNVDYHPDDLEHDLQKHGKKFGITEKGKYITKAKSMIASSAKVFVQEWRDGNLQFLFFGDDGYVVCDTQFFIRGCYFHKGLKNSMRAAAAQQKNKLWLSLNEKN